MLESVSLLKADSASEKLDTDSPKEEVSTRRGFCRFTIGTLLRVTAATAVGAMYFRQKDLDVIEERKEKARMAWTRVKDSVKETPSFHDVYSIPIASRVLFFMKKLEEAGMSQSDVVNNAEYVDCIIELRQMFIHEIVANKSKRHYQAHVDEFLTALKVIELLANVDEQQKRIWFYDRADLSKKVYPSYEYEGFETRTSLRDIEKMSQILHDSNLTLDEVSSNPEAIRQIAIECFRDWVSRLVNDPKLYRYDLAKVYMLANQRLGIDLDNEIPKNLLLESLHCLVDLLNNSYRTRWSRGVDDSSIIQEVWIINNVVEFLGEENNPQIMDYIHRSMEKKLRLIDAPTSLKKRILSGEPY